MKNTIEKALQTLMVLVLFILFFIMMRSVNTIQGAARVVNYADLIQGQTQRLVKLEIAGRPSADLITDLDSYIDGIQSGSAKLNLIEIKDAQFKESVQDLSQNWSALKDEIEKIRANGSENTDIVNLSEENFRLSDETVALAEVYSRSVSSRAQTLGFFIVILLAFLLLLTANQALKALQAQRSLGKYSVPVFWDEHTNLPNKNKCSEIIDQPGLVQTPTAVCIFNLNSLKYVSNNFGRDVADKLIFNFAQLIRASVPQEYFVGRYAADEFIVVLTGGIAQNPKEIMTAIHDAAVVFDQASPETTINYAAGFAKSTEVKEPTMHGLLIAAEKDMFANKKDHKKDSIEFDEQMDASLKNMIQALGRGYSDCCYCNAKTGAYHLFGGVTGTNIPKNGMVKTGMTWLSCLIGDRTERADFLEKLSLPYICAHLDEEHVSYDVTCHFRGVKRNWWKLTAVYIDSDEGQLYHFLLLFKELTDEKEMEFEAKHDGMTGLWTKTAAFEMMEEKINKHQKQYNMLVFDLDDFKHINDTMGHAIGDVVIKKAAEIIGKQFRESDIVARFGGDEFFVFADGELTSDLLTGKATRIRQNLSEFFKQNHDMCDVTISVGIAISHEQAPAADLFHKADEALYSAKRKGKNQSVTLVDGKEVV